MSKAEILAAIQQNKPPLVELPTPFIPLATDKQSLRESFSGMVNQIGGQVLSVENWGAIEAYVHEHFGLDERVVTTIEDLHSAFDGVNTDASPHDFADVSLAILPGHFGVSENAAIWLREDQLGIRVLPFICQHLAIVLRQDEIVANMHEAYERIGDARQTFGVFIAGPSKTADIEQSLVIGAHGARSLLVFMLQ